MSRSSTLSLILLGVMLLIIPACDPVSASKTTVKSSSLRQAPPQSKRTPFAKARATFTTKLTKRVTNQIPVRQPPKDTRLKVVRYPTKLGPMAAFVSTPRVEDRGKRQPLVIWRTGGFSNAISDIYWQAPNPKNDQGASQFRDAGLLMMYPSVRGGNGNPGGAEGFYGEVDDVLWAIKYAKGLPYVDPNRVYLAGHSTGGVVAMLTAAALSRGEVRAVFALGPIDSVVSYGDRGFAFDMNDPQEAKMRAPGAWLGSIETPTFVFEGEGGYIKPLMSMKEKNSNPNVQFFPVPGHDHFTVIAPLNRLIAQKVLDDTGDKVNVTFTSEELGRLR